MQERSLHNVTFAGPQSKGEMRAFLHAADVCVATLQNIAMFRMTYPNKVFDYLAAGRPVVLGIDGVIREVVERAQGGLFVRPGDSHALAHAIRQLAGEPERCREMGEAVGRTCGNISTAATTGSSFTSVLRNAVRDPPRVSS